MAASWLAWPKLISCGVGLFGLGFITITFGECLRLGLFTGPVDPIGLGTWLSLAASVLFFLLSIPLYRERMWALRLLVFVCAIAFVALVAAGVSQVRLESTLTVHGSITKEQLAEFGRGARIHGMISGAIVFCVIVAQGLLTCVLLHPDVVASFRSSRTHEDQKII